MGDFDDYELTTFERLVLNELSGIRAAIEAFAPAQTTGTEEPQCPHPDEAVANFGTTNGQPDWMCKACGFRTTT